MKTINAPTLFAKINDEKTLAYRTFGQGYPIIFANRFRGNLDTWDPAFLDRVAESNTVVIFEYAGKSLSTGKEASTHLEMAEDIIDLADFLKIDKFAVAGWSLGGFVAQVALTEFPDRITQGILIGTRAPGLKATPIRPEFFDYALKPTNDLNDEIVLFFNPKYEKSIQQARLSHQRISERTTDLSIPMSQSQWENMLKVTGFQDDAYNTLDKMKKTNTPIFVMVGEDDICFAAQDWFDLNGEIPSAQITLLEATGHGPQHQYPELSATYITEFLKSNKK